MLKASGESILALLFTRQMGHRFLRHSELMMWPLPLTRNFPTFGTHRHTGRSIPPSVWSQIPCVPYLSVSFPPFKMIIRARVANSFFLKIRRFCQKFPKFLHKRNINDKWLKRINEGQFLVFFLPFLRCFGQIWMQVSSDDPKLGLNTRFQSTAVGNINHGID